MPVPWSVWVWLARKREDTENWTGHVTSPLSSGNELGQTYSLKELGSQLVFLGGGLCLVSDWDLKISGL